MGQGDFFYRSMKEQILTELTVKEFIGGYSIFDKYTIIINI